MASSLTPYKPHVPLYLESLTHSEGVKRPSGRRCCLCDKVSKMILERFSSKSPLTLPATALSPIPSATISTCVKTAPLVVSTVFNFTKLRYYIFSYLQLAEIGITKRICVLWNDSVHLPDRTQHVVNFHHRNRVILSSLLDYDLIARAFKVPHLKRGETDVWTKIFSVGGSTFPQLKTLDLSYTSPEVLHLFSLPTVRMPRVETLNLSFALIEKAVFRALLKKLPLLRTLRLQGFKRPLELPPTLIASKGRNWTSLNLAGCTRINTETLIAFGKECPQLTELDISDTSHIEEEGMQALSYGCRALTSLTMKENAFATAVFSAMVFRQLTLLNMRLCPDLNQVGLEAIRVGCPSLTSLNIEECKGLDENAFSSISYSHLQALNIGKNPSLNTKGVVAISERCPTLTTLELKKCKTLDVDAYQAMVFSALRILDISNCTNLCARRIEALSRGCPTITSLSVTSEGRHTPAIFEAIARLFTQLRILYIVDSSISKKGIQALNKSKSLVSLHLLCPADSQSIQMIPQACPQLTSLNLPFGSEVTPDNLRSIALGCRYLIHIDVSYSSKVTLESIRVIAVTSPHIKTIKFNGCWIKQSLIPLRSEFPHIAFIDQ